MYGILFKVGGDELLTNTTVEELNMAVDWEPDVFGFCAVMPDGTPFVDHTMYGFVFHDVPHGLKCVSCGKIGPDVEHMPDPYDEDVNNRTVMENLCPSCAQNRTDDI